MEGSLVNVQQIMHDPPHVWMQRMQLYGQHIAAFLDKAGGAFHLACCTACGPAGHGVCSGHHSKVWQDVSLVETA